MRVCGGFGRFFAQLGALGLAMTLSGCFGQDRQPEEYELSGTSGAATPSRIAAAASSEDAGAADFARQAGDVVYFEGDSARLSPAASTILRKQIRWLSTSTRTTTWLSKAMRTSGARFSIICLSAQNAPSR